MAYQHRVMPLYLETKKALGDWAFLCCICNFGRKIRYTNQPKRNHWNGALPKTPHYHNTTYFTAIPWHGLTTLLNFKIIYSISTIAIHITLWKTHFFSDFVILHQVNICIFQHQTLLDVFQSIDRMLYLFHFIKYCFFFCI